LHDRHFSAASTFQIGVSVSLWERSDNTAYRRGDALEKRRKLMEAWAAYCEPKRSANVVQMRKGNAL
jgi:hypothetical protein